MYSTIVREFKTFKETYHYFLQKSIIQVISYEGLCKKVTSLASLST